MSLVHIGYVCSHLQNASKVRLGLTSVVASKMHVALLLALQKQGFISSLTLGSKKPPLNFELQQTIGVEEKDQSSTAVQERPWIAYPTASTQRSEIIKLRATVEAPWFEDWDSSDVKPALKREDEIIKQLPIGAFQRHMADRRRLITIRSAMKKLPKSNDTSEEHWSDVEESHSFRGVTELHESEIPELQKLAIWVQEHAAAEEADFPVAKAGKDHRKVLNPEAVLPQDPNHKLQHGLPPLQRIPEIPINPAQRRLWVGLKYFNSEPVLRKMSLISKPTKRITAKYPDLKAILAGRNRNQIKGMVQPGECIFISTDIGMLEIREAVEKKRGGLVICRVS